MNKRILVSVGALMLMGAADARPLKNMVALVPPPPPLSAVTASAKDLSFRDNCALIALNHVMTENAEIAHPEQREVIVAAAWALADKMEAERCRRTKNQ